MAVSLDTGVRPCSGVEVRSIGDGAVVLDLSTGNCFELNRVGFEIWELLAKGATPKSICEALKSRYETAQELLAKDVLRLLDSLIQQKLIQAAPTARDEDNSAMAGPSNTPSTPHR